MRTKAKVDGKYVDVEVMNQDSEYDSEYDSDREENRPPILNPRVQDTALFVSGVGLGLYKGAKELLGYIPNPTGERLRRALPWALLSGLSFFLAPSLGKGKTPVRIAGGSFAVKGIYEYFKKVKEEKNVSKKD
jgi:hypothetical protein